MARISKSVPYSGNFPHREHRSKKGRKNNISERVFNLNKKRKIENDKHLTNRLIGL